MRFGSLFAGIGGFDLGLERSGLECAWQVEIDERCSQVLRRHWPEVQRYGDVRDVGKRNLQPVDLLCGGFPCQDVSVAGRRVGLAGKRSGLWFEFLRVIEEVKPEWIVIENVPGLLSSNSGRDMGTVVGGLAECGYRWAYRCLDAQYFGVAQRRRRVFIVASAGRIAPQEVLFERQSSLWDSPPGREAGAGLAAPIKAGAPGRRNGGSAPIADEFVLADCITGSYASNGGASAGNDGYLRNVVVSYALSAHHGRNNPDGQQLLPEPMAFDTAQITSWCNRARVESGLPAPTLNQDGLTHIAYNWQSGGDVRLGVSKTHISALQANQVPAVGVRRLTPLEAERLQGFPDDWTAWGIDEEGGEAEISNSARYRMLGNAVAVPVAEWIGRRLAGLILS